MKIKEKKRVLIGAASLAQMHTIKELRRIEREAKLARKLRRAWKQVNG